jgi:flagellar hook-basal body complex protein FliE
MTNSIPGFPPGSIDVGNSAASIKPSPSGNSAGNSDFMSTLQGAMGQIGDMQSEADGKVTQLLTGNGQDVHSAMIAIEKANLAFEMMLQVRNKIIAAYQAVSGIAF